MSKEIVIKQKHYRTIKLDSTEPDVVAIIFMETIDPQIVLVEYESIPDLISALQELTKEK